MHNWKEFLCPYDQAVMELTLKFKAISNAFKRLGKYSPIESVYGRVKKINSIIDKMSRKNYSMNEITELDDIAGIRIICQFVEDIARVVILVRERHGHDLSIIEEKDYVTNTKASGYRSYHIIVKYPVITALGKEDVIAEIQIRTMSMNFWATIEHSLKYKYSENIPADLQQRLINCAEAAFKLDNEMATIRNEIMEAQKINNIKANLVTEITNKIQSLHFNIGITDIDSINKEFFDLYEEGNLEELYLFNQKLTVMANMYKIEVE